MDSLNKRVEKLHRTSYGWTSPKNRKKANWKKICISCQKGCRQFCDSSTLVGYKYITEKQRPLFERLSWLLIHILTLCLVGYLTSSMIQTYIERPVETAVATENYPLTDIEFPGISICNINRISKRKAEQFAKDLFSANVINETADQILNLLMHLGSLYETAFDVNGTGNEVVDKMLWKYYNGKYDITKTMKMLSPTCEKGLRSCTLWNETKNCTEIFSFRKTQNGYCCTFNYAREPDDLMNSNNWTKPKAYVNPSAGEISGLSVELRPDLDDYFFPFLPTSGFKITIFNPGDYPDNTSGGVSEVLIAPKTEAYIKLDASTFFSTDAVRRVSLASRKCLFSDESTVLAAGYTYSDCLVDCRVNAIWDLCQCRPFYLPRRGNDEYLKNVCDTGDVECLQENKRKLWSVVLQGNEDPDDNHESLNCNDCYPACDDVKYSLEISSFNLASFNSNRVSNNRSVVHIFFPKFGTIRLKQDIGYYWYELLSDIGGTCGVFVGFSLISVVEFFYIILRLFWDTCCQRKPAELSKLTPPTRDNHYTGGIYWSELMFKPKINFRPGRINQNRKFQKY